MRRVDGARDRGGGDPGGNGNLTQADQCALVGPVPGFCSGFACFFAGHDSAFIPSNAI